MIYSAIAFFANGLGSLVDNKAYGYYSGSKYIRLNFVSPLSFCSSSAIWQRVQVNKYKKLCQLKKQSEFWSTAVSN